MKLYEGKAAIEKAIKLFAASEKAREKELHKVLVSALAHTVEHGDSTVFRCAVDAISTSRRKNAVNDWAIAYGPFVWNEKDKALDFDKDKAKRIRADKAADGKTPLSIATAMSDPFWDFKPEPPYKPVDLLADLKRLVKKAEKAAAEKDAEKAKANKVDAAMLAKLKALAGE